jgi:hypothetical protein
MRTPWTKPKASLYRGGPTTRFAVALTVVVAMSYGSAAYGQSPANGARFPANATIEFFVDDDFTGEQHRLKIARDPMLADVVYDRADYDIGQWFIVPRNRGIAPGRYYWQACWAEPDIAETVCTNVRTLYVTKARTPRLTFRRAESVVRQVFADHDVSWANWNDRRYGCQRVSRIRMTCRPSAWAGDTVVSGKLRMLNRPDGGTRVSGRIVYFSEYCADVTPWRDCTDEERVSGVYYSPEQGAAGSAVRRLRREPRRRALAPDARMRKRRLTA